MDWKLLSPWLLLWIGSFQPSCGSWSSLTCSITASYLKYIKFSLHCSMMISYLTRSFYGYEISGFYCYEDSTRTNIFLLTSILGILHLSIFQDICIYIFFSRKIKLFPSRIFQILLTRVSRTILWLYDRRMFAFPKGFNFISSSELFSNYRGSSSVVNTNDQNVYSDTQNIPRILIHSISNLHFDYSMFSASISFFFFFDGLLICRI